MKKALLSLVFLVAVGAVSLVPYRAIRMGQRGDQTHQTIEPLAVEGAGYRPKAKPLAARNPHLSRAEQLLHGVKSPVELAIDDAKQRGDMETVRRLAEADEDDAPWERTPAWLQKLREDNGWNEVVVTQGPPLSEEDTKDLMQHLRKQREALANWRPSGTNTTPPAPVPWKPKTKPAP